MSVENEQTTFQKKPGKTLLVKELNSDIEYILKDLEGLQTSYKTNNTNSYFLTFDNLENSSNALEHLETDHSDKLKVKYAHYRIFFTIKGLDELSDYNSVKLKHTEYIEKNTQGNVLYYKLYRKNNTFLDCGDLTVDTKDCFDKLMTEDSGFRNYTLDDKLSGSHFRYNKQSK